VTDERCDWTVSGFRWRVAKAEGEKKNFVGLRSGRVVRRAPSVRLGASSARRALPFFFPFADNCPFFHLYIRFLFHTLLPVFFLSSYFANLGNGPPVALESAPQATKCCQVDSHRSLHSVRRREFKQWP